MDRGSTDGSTAVLEEGLRRGLEREALDGDPARPPFAEIARRGRRRQRRRRDVALAGLGTAGVVAAALTWRVGASPDPDTTTVSVASVPEDDPVGLTDEQVHELHLDGWEAWATEPVPPGCEAFAATHPGARGLRRVEVGDNIYGEGREAAPFDDPYAGPGTHLGSGEIIGGDGTVLYRATDPGWMLSSELEEAGGWVYFVEELVPETPIGQIPAWEYRLRRIPSGGGPVEAVPGSPPGGGTEVSPDGRWLSIVIGALRAPDVGNPPATSLILVDLSSGATHELAIDGEAAGSTWSTLWTDEGDLLVFARFEDFGMDCTTGQLMGPMFPGPSDAGRFAVDLDRWRAYRVDPEATSMVGAEVAWPR